MASSSYYAQRYFVELVPTTPQVFATGSGDNIAQDQPEQVIAAIREVVEAVTQPEHLDPSTVVPGSVEQRAAKDRFLVLHARS
jgi:triosephosphate isomerase